MDVRANKHTLQFEDGPRKFMRIKFAIAPPPVLGLWKIAQGQVIQELANVPHAPATVRWKTLQRH